MGRFEGGKVGREIVFIGPLTCPPKPTGEGWMNAYFRGCCLRCFVNRRCNRLAQMLVTRRFVQEGRRFALEIGDGRWEMGALRAGDWRWEMGDWRLEIGDWRLGALARERCRPWSFGVFFGPKPIKVAIELEVDRITGGLNSYFWWANN